MNEIVKSLFDQAQKLTPHERIELVDDNLASLDTNQAEIDRLWVDEVKDRLAAYKRSEIGARDFEDVFADLARK